MNPVIPDVAQLASIRAASKEFAKNIVNFLKAHELSAGHCSLFPVPANDALTLSLGCTIEEFRELGWRVVSHSSTSVGFTDASKRICVCLVSLLIERIEGKQLVHIGH